MDARGGSGEGGDCGLVASDSSGYAGGRKKWATAKKAGQAPPGAPFHAVWAAMVGIVGAGAAESRNGTEPFCKEAEKENEQNNGQKVLMSTSRLKQRSKKI